MRCVAPERIAADTAGATNVRSTPLSISIDASDFSLAITSTLLPLTSNSTIACQLHTTHPFTHIALEDFVVKNGFLVSLDPEVHTVYNRTTGIETYYYDFTIKATVQGQVCVDILKSRTIFGMSEIDTFISTKNHLPNPLPLSFCITHGMSNTRSLIIRFHATFIACIITSRRAYKRR